MASIGDGPEKTARLGTYERPRARHNRARHFRSWSRPMSLGHRRPTSEGTRHVAER